jgi:hypothetical protein
MAFASKDGKQSNSKFRANRRDREGAAKEGMESQPSPGGEPHPKQASGGTRAQAAKIEAKPAANKSEAQSPEPSGQEGQAAGLSAQHGPASEVHITHDHVNGKHHTHTVHADGFENHSDHNTADEAHMAGAAAGGVNPEGNYPENHEQPETDYPDGDDFEVEPLR